MNIKIVTAKDNCLKEYVKIPISFTVNSIFKANLINQGLNGVELTKEQVKVPYEKNYDLQSPPSSWPDRFNTSKWDFILAYNRDELIGGAILVCKSDEINLLESRSDLALVWDLRVSSNHRLNGVGQKLFNEAINSARENGCTQIKVETQNTNVPACIFYQKQGCELGLINRFAYKNNAETKNEIQICWYYNLNS